MKKNKTKPSSLIIAGLLAWFIAASLYQILTAKSDAQLELERLSNNAQRLHENLE